MRGERISRSRRAEGLVILSLCISAVTSISTLTARPAAADSFRRVDLDVNQGVFVERDSPYAADFKLAPALLDFRRFRLQIPTVGVSKVSPKWDLSISAAPSFVLVPMFTPYTGLRVVAEISYFLRNEWRATGGLVIDADSLHVGEIAGYDGLHRSAILLTTLGVDLPVCFSAIFE